MLVEKAGQRLRRGWIDGAGLGGIEFDVFDAALFVLVVCQCFQQGLGRLEAGRNCACDLAPQRDAALIGDIARFSIAELADDGLEALRIEGAANALEIRIGKDHPHGLGIGLPKPEPAHFLIQCGFCDRLL